MQNGPQRLDGWAVMNEHDKLIGLDDSTGGYPFTPHSINRIQVWLTLEAAQEYCNIMNVGSYGEFTPVFVELRVK